MWAVTILHDSQRSSDVLQSFCFFSRLDFVCLEKGIGECKVFAKKQASSSGALNDTLGYLSALDVWLELFAKINTYWPTPCINFSLAYCM